MDTATKDSIIDNYWIKKLRGKQIYAPSTHNVYWTQRTVIESSDLSYFSKITNDNALAKFTLVTSIYLYLLKRYFIDFQGYVCLFNDLDNVEKNKPLILGSDEKQNIIFKDYLLKVKREVQNCLKYKNYQNDKLAERLNVKSLTNYSRFGLNIGNVDIENGFGVVLNLESMNDNDLVFSLRYEKDFIESFLIEHLARNFEQLLIGLKEIINKPLNEIEILNSKEKAQILNEFNNTATIYPQNKTIIDLFEIQVNNSPDNIAIIYEGKQFTYAEINSLANQLGSYLGETYHVTTGDIVGVKLERSELMIIAIYGILKSGAAYVPIDPNYPQKRIDYIETDTNCKIILDFDEMNSFLMQKSNYSSSNLSKNSSPNDLAYIIYTSGTTGFPKGVMIENTSLVNRLTWMQKAYSLSNKDTLIQKTTYAFDVSVWEIFWWSIYGAKLAIPSPGIEKDAELLIQNIFSNKVTVIHFVPSALSIFLKFLQEKPEKIEMLSTLKQAFVSGEALTQTLRNNFTQLLPNVSLMNLYGPTEATIDVSYFDCTKNYKYNCLPIGKPIDNTKLFILDEQNKLLPIGIVGKLFISGVGLSRGYINKKELTQEKFINNPFEENSKMYDTGDLARWLPDGNIDFMGRMDNQIKFRGYRIELGEIEKVLMHQPEINHAIVDLRVFKENQVLAAYLVWNKGIEKVNLRVRLQKLLPEYMIPSFYINMESLPVKENGKLNRNTLPDLQEEHTIQNIYKVPKNQLQRDIADIWQEVLGIKKIGINDNFFELGGHSLMVTQIINRMSKKVNKTISVKDFLSLATIEKIEVKLKNEHYNEIPKTSDFEEIII